MLHIANDVEGAGSRLGFHPTLSFGSCVVTREPLTFKEANERGLLFYTEIRPSSLTFEIEAMLVSCLHLKCLEGIRGKDSRYDPIHKDFNPLLVLKLMRERCEDPVVAMERFRTWVETVSNGEEVEGLTDTVFYDGGHINLCFGLNSAKPSPFGWTGLDLDSLYRGYEKRADAKLRELGVPDNRTKPHRADHDAVLLAEMARVLLYEKMGW